MTGPLPLHIQEPAPDPTLAQVIHEELTHLSSQLSGSPYIAARLARAIEARFHLIRTEDVIGG